MMNRDKLVAIRNGMVMVLQQAVKEGNQSRTKTYERAVDKIKSMEGYDVVNANTNTYKGVEYGGVIHIMEHGKPIMALCSSLEDKLISLEVDIEDLLTDAELEARRSMTPDDIIDGLMGKAVEPI